MLRYAPAPSRPTEEKDDIYHPFALSSIDQCSFGMQAFTIGHTFEDDLSPDAGRELNGFFFENL
jgi:hypothetical protein